MKALSIRQPWAWLIIHGGKDIENRTWHTKHRGRFAIHASQGMTRLEYHAARDYALERGVHIPALADLQRGGSSELHTSPTAGIPAFLPGTWARKLSC